jgi:ABC-type polar amino acid transport system ATPase subunit
MDEQITNPVPPRKIITAADRTAAPRGAKILIAGPTGVGKTTLLRTLDLAPTLFIDAEAGDIAVQDLNVDTTTNGAATPHRRSSRERNRRF